MNVLELLQQTANSIGIPSPGAYTSNVQLLSLLYDVCRELRSSRAFPQQKRRFSFDTTASRTKYPLPEDFYSGLLGTQREQTNEWALVGPVNDAQFNYWLYGPGYTLGRTSYRVFGPDTGLYTVGGQMELTPTPASAFTISYDYITASMFRPREWTPATALTLNEYRFANGNIYKTTTAGTTDASTAPTHTSGAVANGTATLTYISAPYETVLAGTDLCVFDDAVVIQGLKAYFDKAKKFPSWEAEYALFQKHIDKAKARWTGPIRGSMSRRNGDFKRFPNPTGGWPI